MIISSLKNCSSTVPIIFSNKLVTTEKELNCCVNCSPFSCHLINLPLDAFLKQIFFLAWNIIWAHNSYFHPGSNCS